MTNISRDIEDKLVSFMRTTLDCVHARWLMDLSHVVDQDFDPRKEKSRLYLTSFFVKIRMIIEKQSRKQDIVKIDDCLDYLLPKVIDPTRKEKLCDCVKILSTNHREYIKKHGDLKLVEEFDIKYIEQVFNDDKKLFEQISLFCLYKAANKGGVHLTLDNFIFSETMIVIVLRLACSISLIVEQYTGLKIYENETLYSLEKKIADSSCNKDVPKEKLFFTDKSFLLSYLG